MSLTELESLKASLKSGNLHPMEAKKALGREIVDRYHGEGAGRTAQDNFVSRFRDNQTPEEMPEIFIQPEGESMLLCKLLAQAGLVPSNSEGRRSIKGGGVKVDGDKISDENLEITCCGAYVIQVGKRRFARIVF